MWNKTAFQPKPAGVIFIVASPSGGGKSSLINRLIEDVDGLCKSVSHTTREQRPAETHGEHYHFIEESEFFAMRDNNEFVETASIYGGLWWSGTSKAAIQAAIDAGHDVVLDIDWQGAQAIKALFPDRTVTIFLLPPSREVLLERLRGRGRDDEAAIQARMAEAEAEASHCHEFDYLVINDDFDDALKQLESIVISVRCRYRRQMQHYQGLVMQLLPK